LLIRWLNRGHSFSAGSTLCCYCCLVAKSGVQLFGTPWTVAHQAPLPMGFPMQEYRNGLPFPSPGDLPDPGIEQPRSPILQEDCLLSHLGSLWLEQIAQSIRFSFSSTQKYLSYMSACILSYIVVRFHLC